VELPDHERTLRRDLFDPRQAGRDLEPAAPIPGCDKAIWRCDDHGRIIRWADYDDRFSRYGWAIVRERGESRLARALGLAGQGRAPEPGRPA
jgi:hypothetical protein